MPKFGLRTKLFLMLAFFALAPMVAITLIGKATLDNAAETVATRTGAEMHALVAREVQRTALAVAEFQAMEKAFVDYALEGLARDAALALASAPPSTSEVDLYMVRDFESTATAPSDAAPESLYDRVGMHGARASTPVSFSHPAFLVPRGASPLPDRQDMMRLTRLTPAFKRVFLALGSGPYRCYVTLESGLHTTYPGQGGFPRGFDPRTRRHYQDAREQNEIVWRGPYIDPATRRVVYSAAAPIRDEQSVFLGIAGLDVLLPAMLAEQFITTDWTPSSSSFVVTLRQKDDGHRGLSILAKREYAGEGSQNVGMRRGMGMRGMMGSAGHRAAMTSAWREPIEHEWLESDDPNALREFILTMQNGQTGFSIMPLDGKQSVWAFAAFPDDGKDAGTTYQVVIVPEAVVNALPDQARAAVHREFGAQSVFIAATAAAAVFLALLVALVAARKSTRPLQAMADTAARLAEGDFTAHIPLETGDERDIVIGTLNEMGPKLRDRMRTTQALHVAREVQRKLLPAKAPDIPGHEVAGLSIYSDETGGDYYDYFALEEGGHAVVVGDVSGHGVGAALVMASARSKLRAVPQSGGPAKRIARVNDLLVEDLFGTGHFLTLFYMEIAPDGALRWVRAGHDPALLYDPQKDAFVPLGGSGMALGVLAKTTFEESASSPLPPDAIVAIGTDGIWEARNPDNEMFGHDRLHTVLRDNASRPAEAIRDAVIDAVRTFVKGREFADDVTLVVVKKTAYPEGKQSPMEDDGMAATLNIHITSEHEGFDPFAEEVRAFAEQSGLTPGQAYKMTLALDEMVTNTLEYGYDKPGGHDIAISITIGEERSELRIEDNARPFNPLEAEPPDTTSPPSPDSKPGGMGIHLMRHCMPETSYRRENDKNVLTLARTRKDDAPCEEACK